MSGEVLVAIPVYNERSHVRSVVEKVREHVSDVLVVDDPALLARGEDPQLDAAIAVMLTEIRDHPYVPPMRPSPPDRSGMGIRNVDR